LNDWNFNEKNAKLLEELKNINSSVDIVLQEVFETINTYDSEVIKFWIDEGIKPKVESYLLRYVIPLYELIISEKKKNISNALVIQLLSCISWRTLDNCNDFHEEPYKAHLNSLRATLHLYEFSKNCTTKKILSSLESHYKLMTEQAVNEKTRPIKLNNIWKRCSIFLFASEEIFNLSKDKVELYKQYINYSGLAHDTHDYFSDLSSKVISLPVYWMRELNCDEVFSVNAVKMLYSKVRKEVEPLEHNFKLQEVYNKFPLISYLLIESFKTFHDE
jgi:hypothetical protein